MKNTPYKFKRTECAILLCIFLFSYGLLSSITHAKEKDYITVPIVFIQDVPHVELNINGHKAIFLLDTGSSSGLHLTKEWMNKINNLHIFPNKQASTDLTGEINYAEQFTIPAITINNMSFNSIEGNELVPWGLSLGDDSESLKQRMTIGLGLFKDKQLLLDYDKNIMIIAEPEVNLSSYSSKWQEIPFLLDQAGLLIKLKQNNQLYSFVFDTGASVTVTSSKNLTSLSKIPCKEASFEFDESGDESCQATIFEVDEIPVPIKISALDIATYGADITALGKDGLIGTNFFQKHNILINIKNKKVWISVE